MKLKVFSGSRITTLSVRANENLDSVWSKKKAAMPEHRRLLNQSAYQNLM
jgi:hypothetical protein